MTPCSIVQPLEGKYKGSAGRVESVEKDDAGAVKSAIVKMDTDGELVKFAAKSLRVLVNH